MATVAFGSHASGDETGGEGGDATRLNGFVLEPSAIPREEILVGGPPRDGIPALDQPAVVAAKASPWDDGDMVVGVAVGDEARAYPIAVLMWHELVNDTVGDTPILVSFCPLCGTAMVFDRRVDGKPQRFGVSGLLYQSDLMMYDHATESLWSQIRARAETGPALGKRLRLVRSQLVRWGDWRRQHPKSDILSRETGHPRDYSQTPYGDYASNEATYFPVSVDPRYHPKTPTLGLRSAAGDARGYPAPEVVRAGGWVSESFAGETVVISFDREGGTFTAEVPEGIDIVEGFWFAWAAFHPKASVFSPPSAPSP